MNKSTCNESGKKIINDLFENLLGLYTLISVIFIGHLLICLNVCTKRNAPFFTIYFVIILSIAFAGILFYLKFKRHNIQDFNKMKTRLYVFFNAMLIEGALYNIFLLTLINSVYNFKDIYFYLDIFVLLVFIALNNYILSIAISKRVTFYLSLIDLKVSEALFVLSVIIGFVFCFFPSKVNKDVVYPIIALCWTFVGVNLQLPISTIFILKKSKKAKCFYDVKDNEIIDENKEKEKIYINPHNLYKFPIKIHQRIPIWGFLGVLLIPYSVLYLILPPLGAIILLILGDLGTILETITGFNIRTYIGIYLDSNIYDIVRFILCILTTIFILFKFLICGAVLKSHYIELCDDKIIISGFFRDHEYKWEQISEVVVSKNDLQTWIILVVKQMDKTKRNRLSLYWFDKNLDKKRLINTLKYKVYKKKG